ncbi:bacteriocin fulvocin C-related protein [Mucilaginibacter myungsuensis]|uniref:Bacteriocin fulvocin C-related protein n=1 Tax=Mucilaginibacter myungsuensis TaxID=649104 RepID=A0A929KXP8_9SPHI|nr:bacteriocin fulvocin C-related protein [Mucilaginibacter myungsuensis]MBE9661853.1 bacteriocin fulvocin C-related protein [Mucilaginibacter myungsuensis]MDN3599713.1 bacteriocin fulvocin C-related protein [Mucilaginibacter myungsuensis]
MKKIITLSLLLGTLLFAQCKKDAAVTEAPAATETIKAGSETVTVTQENQLAVQSVFSLPNKKLIKLGFKTLESVEKYLFWIENIRKASAKYTPEQKAVVNEFVAFLRPKHFTDDYKSELLIFSIKWEEKATKVLSTQQLQYLIYDVATSSDLQVNGVDAGGSGTCDCSQSSPFCARGWDPKEGCEPQLTAACSSTDGCGLGWAYRCNGLCFSQKENAE